MYGRVGEHTDKRWKDVFCTAQEHNAAGGMEDSVHFGIDMDTIQFHVIYLLYVVYKCHCNKVEVVICVMETGE